MTREEARKAAEVMKAYADGKTVEAYRRGNSVWFELYEEPRFNWKEFDYRIKQEPIYRPFKDKEECWAEMQKHQPLGWVKNMLGSYVFVPLISAHACIDINGYDSNFTEAFKSLEFIDGTPFGIKEE